MFGGIFGHGGWRPPRPGDPSALDIARLSKAQLEMALHNVAAERTRLDAVENLVQEGLKRQAQPAKGK